MLATLDVVIIGLYAVSTHWLGDLVFARTRRARENNAGLFLGESVTALVGGGCVFGGREHLRRANYWYVGIGLCNWVSDCVL